MPRAFKTLGRLTGPRNKYDVARYYYGLYAEARSWSSDTIYLNEFRRWQLELGYSNVRLTRFYCMIKCDVQCRSRGSFWSMAMTSWEADHEAFDQCSLPLSTTFTSPKHGRQQCSSKRSAFRSQVPEQTTHPVILHSQSNAKDDTDGLHPGQKPPSKTY